MLAGAALSWIPAHLTSSPSANVSTANVVSTAYRPLDSIVPSRLIGDAPVESLLAPMAREMSLTSSDHLLDLLEGETFIAPPPAVVAKRMAVWPLAEPVETCSPAAPVSPSDEPPAEVLTKITPEITPELPKSVPVINQCADGKCEKGPRYGTAFTWAESPKQARELAQQQNKLVFLIQVSGNFAKEEFT